MSALFDLKKANSKIKVKKAGADLTREICTDFFYVGRILFNIINLSDLTTVKKARLHNASWLF